MLSSSSILGKKLLVSILLISSLITLVLTSLQLYRDFNVDVSLIEQRLELIEQTRLGSITNNLWTFNLDVLQVQLDGLTKIQDVQYVAIITKNGQRTQHSGDAYSAKGIEREYPINYDLDGEVINLGKLHVTATLSGVYHRLQDKAMIILLTQGIKTFIVSAFIIFIVQILVTAPITRLSRYSNDWLKTKKSSLLSPPVRKVKTPDEITDLYSSVIGMQQGLMAALESSEGAVKRFQQIFDGSNDSIVMVDLESRSIVDANLTAIKLFGYSHEEILAIKADELHPDELVPLNEFFQTVAKKGHSRTSKLSCRTKQGEKIPAEISASILNLDNKKIVLAMVRDIREQIKAQEDLKSLAYHDALTGLPNRLLLEDRFEIILSHAKRNKEKCALIYFDIDNFKTINDSLGHDVGDQLLIQLSQRINKLLRNEDTFARLGGDEFVLISSSSRADYAQLYQLINVMLSKIFEASSKPFNLAGKSIESTFSAGVAVYPDNGTSVAELQKNADVAMYRAKSLGRNQFVFFTDDLSKAMDKTLLVQTSLTQALEDNELFLVYQPKIDVVSNKVMGAEALLRWNSKEFGLISPVEFIPILENTGQISIIDQWVMEMGCKQWKKAIENGLISRDLKLSINISGKGFGSDGYIDKVKSNLKMCALNAENLELEITEQSMLSNINGVESEMNRLVDLGIDIALDDFGTGYSSLSYLNRLPVKTLKIDRSFIVEIGKDKKQSSLIESIIDMSHNMGISVVAEGVETEQQMKFLEQHKCDVIQGFYFSKPLSWTDFCAFVDSHNKP